MKQTAVEWLVEQLENHNGVTRAGFEKCIQEAKAMEKKQLCYFYIKGVEGEMNNPYVTNIEFYNKTFKKTEK